MGVHYPNEAPLTRRAFLRLSAVTAAGLALAACAPAAPTQLTEADSAKAASLTATPGQQVIAMAVSPIERLVRLSNSVLLVPETVVNDPKKTAD